MYNDQGKVYLRNEMKRDIANFVIKFPNCQQGWLGITCGPRSRICVSGVARGVTHSTCNLSKCKKKNSRILKKLWLKEMRESTFNVL